MVNDQWVLYKSKTFGRSRTQFLNKTIIYHTLFIFYPNPKLIEFHFDENKVLKYNDYHTDSTQTNEAKHQ